MDDATTQVAPVMPAGPPSASGIDLMINHAAAQYNIDPQIFRAMLMRESSLNPNAVGPGGERGIAQFTPATAQTFGIDPSNPQQAIPAAALYLRNNLNRFGNRYEDALAAYNWGPGNVAKFGMAGAPQSVRDYVTKIIGGGGMGGSPRPGTGGTPLANAVTPPANAMPTPPPVSGPASPSPSPDTLALGGAGANGPATLASSLFGASALQQQLAKNAGLVA